ncbi:MAG: type III pantothenate kinase [Phycisphaerales bacterium]|nr:type III pantothenate kinase [Phycisphaerales bacterium]MCB9864178.1 type III pantothenate kinase [Phycisphaerales bacterium]
MDALDDPRASAALLIFEVGNSHVSVATSVSDRVYTNFRFDLGDAAGIDHAAEEAWAALPSDRLRAAAAASVVPEVTAQLRQRVPSIIGEPLRFVGSELHRPLSLALEEPDLVGLDRVCAAAAAYETLGHACVVASFGTAITIDCVNDEGAFMGGAIIPGLSLQAKSLGSGTAQLPEVTIEAPTSVFGTDTVSAIRNGIVFGAIGAIREIVERYADSLGRWPNLVVTGGNADLIRSQCDFIDHVVPDLCIRGIALAHKRHFSTFREPE